MNNDRNERLHIYAQIGMFMEEPAGEDAGKPIYRYSLTPLGTQYFYQRPKYSLFCFGRIIVDDVMIGSARENSLGQTVKGLSFKYHIENIPDWVTNNYQVLSELYKSDLEKSLSNGTYGGAGQLVKTPNGWALDGAYYSIIY